MPSDLEYLLAGFFALLVLGAGLAFALFGLMRKPRKSRATQRPK